MSKHFTKEELEKIVYLKDIEGYSHKQIATELNRIDGKGLPASRAIMKQYKKAKASGVKATPLPSSSSPVPPPPSPNEEKIDVAPRTLSEMGTNERVRHLRAIMPQSPRGKYFYDKVFDVEERAIFEEEYFRILADLDTITAAEEGVLFMSIVHLVLAMQAQARDKDAYSRSPQAGYKGQDVVQYTDQWSRAFHDNMKKYESMMKSLRLSREQRLQNIKSLGTTFLDYAERVARTGEQEQIADEILKLEYASEQSLKELQENGWIIGGGLGNNNECCYEASDVEKKKKEKE